MKKVLLAAAMLLSLGHLHNFQLRNVVRLLLVVVFHT